MAWTWITDVLYAFWETLLDVAPFLLLGFLVAGLLSIFISAQTIQRHLGRGYFMPVLKSSLLGVPLPLCSCGVIPVMASLRRNGANEGATTAFLISTPQTGVDSILVTYSLLGLPFALFRLVAAFLSGLVGGLAAEVAARKGRAVEAPEPEKPACCCSDTKSPARRWKDGLHHGLVVLPRDIARPVLVGLAIAALIAVAVPPSFFSEGFGSGFGAKLLMLAVGIPVYVCATATVPVAASLIMVGVSPGTALVLLMSGPSTNAATITTVIATMGRSVAAVYLAVVALTSLGAGMLFDAFFSNITVQAAEHIHTMLPYPLRVAMAVLLLGLLLGTRLWKTNRS